MTGEKKAEHFLRWGALKPRPKLTVVFYSDGFIPFVYDSHFADLLIQSQDIKTVEDFIKEKEKEGDKFKKEKSLILLKIN